MLARKLWRKKVCSPSPKNSKLSGSAVLTALFVVYPAPLIDTATVAANALFS